MAEDAKPWDAVFDRVRISRPPGDVWPGVSEAELAAAEAELGTPLPASYRAFATRFGLGGLFWWLHRLLPLTASRGTNCATVQRATQWMRDHIVAQAGWYTSAQQDRLSRFIFFGDDLGNDTFLWDPEGEGSYGGGVFAWDPTELVTSGVPDYPVYYCARSRNAVERRSGSFTEFVAWADIHGREAGGDDEFASADYIRWEPRDVRKRKQPPKRDVKLWLASNNHTARDLALSIRDEGRADAFPILADALQDAGCAHPDLLDACRTGDSDIDGKWVLQVLLGGK